jgi:hypothetical protein
MLFSIKGKHFVVPYMLSQILSSIFWLTDVYAATASNPMQPDQ